MSTGINGPFPNIKFCGASVTAIQSNAGWQDQESTLQIDLVEGSGDRFLAPESGTPLSFVLDGFRFDGIVQKYTTRRGIDADPVYKVYLMGPTQILENVTVILDGYRGINLSCPNLINVFGYLEDGGNNFGGSQKNEGGIPWHLVTQAIQACQGGQTPFSTGISLKGYSYQVDMSALPSTPDFYRVASGVNATLMSLIQTVCNDAAYDFIATLTINGGINTIGFKARSKQTAQLPGQIANFVEGNDSVISWEEGTEFRNDSTCGVIIGGDIEQATPLFDSGAGETIYPFWGLQTFNPTLIPFATAGNQPINPSTSISDDNFYSVTLDASAIADIIGQTVYQCNIFEMRLALANFDSWSVYIARFRPEVAALCGLTTFPSIFTSDSNVDPVPQALFNSSREGILLFSNIYEPGSPQIILINKVYNFVRASAENMYGRQFIVRIPFFLKYQFESETNQLLYNMDIGQDGYWPDYLNQGQSGPLGLLYQNFNAFMTSNGKFIPYVKFTGNDLQYVNLAGRSQADYIAQPDGIYMQCQVNPAIIFTPAPAAVLSISEPLWEVPDHPTLGNVEEIAFLLGMDPTALLLQVSQRPDFPIFICPAAYRPLGVNLCFKSNEMTYGPWTNIGVAGKVEVDHNPSFVPWEYGGFDTMNKAAMAQLASIGSTNQTEVTGSVSFTGTPGLSLGDALADVGPVLTSIDAEISSSGVTTTYQMASQTPVFGRFSRQNADRMKRLGQAAQDMRRNLRQMFERIRESQAIIFSTGTYQGALYYSAALKLINEQAAYNALVTLEEDGTSHVQMFSQDFPASLAHSNAHDDGKFQKVAVMGMEGLYRPFSTDVNATNLPHYQTPQSGLASQAITNNNLNPFQQGNDMLWLASGNTFNGFYGKNADANTTRPIGLRGPLVMVGHGVDLDGNPIPNSSFGNLQDLSNSYETNYLNKFHTWPVGAIDLRWDKWRKMWASNGMVLLGTMTGDIAGGASEFMTIKGFNDTIKVTHWLGTNTIKQNTKVAAGYYPMDGTWYIIAAGCAPAS